MVVMSINSDLKATFGQVSKLYDFARSGYPQDLINDVILLSGIPEDGKILEVGCGSGKATVMLGGMGRDLLALDISDALITVARKNTSHLPNVDYKIVSFEDADVNPNSFDLIVAAQSWHWVDPSIGYPKAHKILTESGSIAVICKHQDDKRSSFVRRFRVLYKSHCPNFHNNYEGRHQRLKESMPSHLFGNIKERTYEGDIEFSKEKYLALVQTFSYVAALSEEKRGRFLDDLSDLLKQESEPLSIPYKYILLEAKRSKKSN